MEYLDFTNKMCNIKVDSLKKSILILRTLYYLSLAVIIFDSVYIYQEIKGYTIHYPGIITIIGFGFIISNIFWLGTNLSCYKENLKLEKDFLLYVNKKIQDSNIDGMVKQLEEAKNYYRDAIYSNKVSNAACPESTQPESASPGVEKS